MEWIKVSDKLPEDFPHLDDSLEDLQKTKEVLVYTDMGTCGNTSRLKMQVGEKEWTWFMTFQDENITHWTEFTPPSQGE